MKRFLFSMLMVLSAMLMVGCPPPESYVKASEMALTNSQNFDKNVNVLGKNYYTFISRDTEAKVKAGKMTPEAREAVLKEVKEQMANLKEQSVLNAKFVEMAHDYAHDGKLKLEDVLDTMTKINKAYPDIKDFIDKLGGD